MSERKCTCCSSKIDRRTRGDLCQACYRARNNNNAPMDDTGSNVEGMSDASHNVSGLLHFQNLDNASFAGQPGTPPQTIEEMYSLFLQMRSDFSTAIQERDVTIANLTSKVALLEGEVKAKLSSTADNTKIVTDMEEYSSNMKTMKETVAAQQKTLEDLQQDKRAKNIIITGVPEPDGAPSAVDARKADQSAIDRILAAVECPGIAPARVTRLGKKQERDPNDQELTLPDIGNRQQPLPRPLLVTLSSPTDVRSVLTNTKELKNHASYSKVYIKRDEHPLIRQEWKRLRAVARKEKAAPINAACEIKLDYKKKAVTRNGEIIHEFVSPFRLQGPNNSV